MRKRDYFSNRHLRCGSAENINIFKTIEMGLSSAKGFKIDICAAKVLVPISDVFSTTHEEVL